VRFVALGGGTSVQVGGRALLTLAGVAPTSLDGARDLIVR
jgi:hypothetical protein